MSRGLAEKVPGAKIVVAYRDKTPKAHDRAKELAAKSDPNIVRFACNVPDIHALVKAATAVLFPVDDLYGKVDLPIVLLEAFRLDTPVVALDEGPLASLDGALLLGNDERDWLSAAERLAGDGSFREKLSEQGRRAIERHYQPREVARAYEDIYFELLAP
jgi:glycosyltransferase involved in cell wall biosynthesis